MKKLILIAALSAALWQPSVQAGERASLREVAGVTGGAVVGALAGGPVGLVVGVALGAHYGASVDRVEAGAERQAALERTLEKAQHDVVSSDAKIDALSSALALADKEIAELDSEIERLFIDRAVLDGLDFDVRFRTADAELAERDKARLVLLSQLMKRVPDLVVTIDGHADARGATDYNERLSRERAHAVTGLLSGLGVSEARIKWSAHGETLAIAADGDVEGYAADRRAAIRLSLPRKADSDPVAHAP